MFDPDRFVDEAVKDLKEQIKGKALIACSGGVDSTVCAVLANRALGDDLYALHVNTGLLRKGESEEVKKLFEQLGIKLYYLDESDRFFEALKGVVDPEEKRKIIGELFIRIFEEFAERHGIEYLIQGTIAPDWIESGDELRETIKSHHNVGGLPENVKLKIVEPLRDLYKDEVRKVARYLNLPISERQPFPGPGLAIRVVGEVTRERVEIVREACSIVEEEIEKASESGKIKRPWQYFAVLIPVKTVGVHGDKRAYGYTIAVRAIDSVDAMSGSFSRVPYDVLDRIATRISNEMGDKVTRVVYDITNKPPATIEWE
ncbi:MAG: glutamine-hydrolyzing GMP synthase subunit GuaA [Thermoplasmata archaeon]|nr:MAG: glutamine-hydrolyzing GMP synthase subunit GuaA [Thermoplasmata archaeon]RLF52461.1 MAG: glutamine-hydrolyzing GMP synthase subunit GuaA [Thermoplasmata archaeon]